MQADHAADVTGDAPVGDTRGARADRGLSLPILCAICVAVIVMAGAIWLTIERAPALLLDLAKLPWCG